MMQLASGVIAVERIVVHAVDISRDITASIFSIRDILKGLLVLIQFSIFTS